MKQVGISLVVGLVWLLAGAFTYQSILSGFDPIPQTLAMYSRDTFNNDPDDDGLELAMEDPARLQEWERRARQK